MLSAECRSNGLLVVGISAGRTKFSHSLGMTGESGYCVIRGVIGTYDRVAVVEPAESGVMRHFGRGAGRVDPVE